MVLNFFLELAQLENSPADLPKRISTLLRTEQCDIAVLSIDDVGGDIVTWERLAVRLAWACGISEDTQSMSHMCIASRTREAVQPRGPHMAEIKLATTGVADLPPALRPGHVRGPRA